jgi:hypothetical protein
VAWTAAYTDVGTGEAVMTCSKVIRDHRGSLVGVVAIDVATSDLPDALAAGWPNILNLTYLFLLCIILAAILYASNSWEPFRFIVYAFGLWYVFYFVRTLLWLLPTTSPDGLKVAQSVETLFSMTNSCGLLVASALVFGQPRIAGTSGRRRIVERLDRYLQSRQGISPLFEGAGWGLMAWIVTVVATILFKEDNRVVGGQLLARLMDAVLACIALMWFGKEFGRWFESFSARWVGETAMIMFAVYAVEQLLYPKYWDHTAYWWALLISKVIAFTLVAIAIYRWVDLTNRANLRVARMQSSLLQAEGVEREVVAVRGKEEILFCSRSLAHKLGWSQGDYDTHPVLDDQALIVPKRDVITLRDLFVPEYRRRLHDALLGRSPDHSLRRVVPRFLVRLQTRHAPTPETGAIPAVVSVVMWPEHDRSLGKSIQYSVGFIRIVSRNAEARRQASAPTS